jgi:two-component system cell cycle response regulator
MFSDNINVLLIEDNPGDARLIKEALKDAEDAKFNIVFADRLETGIEKIDHRPVDIILLDLFLPDSGGLETVDKMLMQVPETPILVLTGMNDKSLAVEAVRKGAQDYLAKGKVNPGMLSRSIRYAIERQRLRDEIRSLTLVDLLTGLHNRRGFEVLGERELKLARRYGDDLVLLFFDLDGFKAINDNFGHRAGDQALKEFSAILTQVYRDSDLVARIGGDEFVVLTRDRGTTDTEALAERLEQALEERNRKPARLFKLKASYGSARYRGSSVESVQQLTAAADRAMYKHKKGKHTLI